MSWDGAKEYQPSLVQPWPPLEVDPLGVEVPKIDRASANAAALEIFRHFGLDRLALGKPCRSCEAKCHRQSPYAKAAALRFLIVDNITLLHDLFVVGGRQMMCDGLAGKLLAALSTLRGHKLVRSYQSYNSTGLSWEAHDIEEFVERLVVLERVVGRIPTEFRGLKVKGALWDRYAEVWAAAGPWRRSSIAIICRIAVAMTASHCGVPLPGPSTVVGRGLGLLAAGCVPDLRGFEATYTTATHITSNPDVYLVIPVAVEAPDGDWQRRWVEVVAPGQSYLQLAQSDLYESYILSSVVVYPGGPVMVANENAEYFMPVIQAAARSPPVM